MSKFSIGQTVRFNNKKGVIATERITGQFGGEQDGEAFYAYGVFFDTEMVRNETLGYKSNYAVISEHFLEVVSKYDNVDAGTAFVTKFDTTYTIVWQEGVDAGFRLLNKYGIIGRLYTRNELIAFLETVNATIIAVKD